MALFFSIGTKKGGKCGGRLGWGETSSEDRLFCKEKRTLCATRNHIIFVLLLIRSNIIVHTYSSALHNK